MTNHFELKTQYQIGREHETAVMWGQFRNIYFYEIPLIRGFPTLKQSKNVLQFRLENPKN